MLGEGSAPSAPPHEECAAASVPAMSAQAEATSCAIIASPSPVCPCPCSTPAGVATPVVSSEGVQEGLLRLRWACDRNLQVGQERRATPLEEACLLVQLGGRWSPADCSRLPAAAAAAASWGGRRPSPGLRVCRKPGPTLHCCLAIAWMAGGGVRVPQAVQRQQAHLVVCHGAGCACCPADVLPPAPRWAPGTLQLAAGGGRARLLPLPIWPRPNRGCPGQSAPPHICSPPLVPHAVVVL